MSDKNTKQNEDEIMNEMDNSESVSEVVDQPDNDDKASEYLAGWQRALADYKNLQERMAMQSSLTSEAVKAGIFSDIVPVIDNFNSALLHVPDENKNDEWVIGLFHVKQQLTEVCRKHGLELIDQVDVNFDPNIHEAISHQPSEKPPDTIINVVSVGLRISEKIIKPAKVIVASEIKN